MSANTKWGMSDAQREAWNNRQLTVKVTTYCETCRALKDDVKPRESNFYYPLSGSIKMTSCLACFEDARRGFSCTA